MDFFEEIQELTKRSIEESIVNGKEQVNNEIVDDCIMQIKALIINAAEKGHWSLGMNYKEFTILTELHSRIERRLKDMGFIITSLPEDPTSLDYYSVKQKYTNIYWNRRI